MGIKYGGNRKQAPLSGRGEEGLLSQADTHSSEEVVRSSIFFEYESESTSGDVCARGDRRRHLQIVVGGATSQLIHACKERLAQNKKQIENLQSDNTDLEKTIAELEKVTELFKPPTDNTTLDSST